ncbi:hypothetical protein PT015_15165 [Candidatus Mycobacterium wuenschmannii]|uniref:Secreted protein n=1 Tax=Candidatus Mycobacterium wuenschmannii TaxID=3027808 RepID=A0ABY8VRI1_9MYCO|nr:hypothetical protein [Candidatus Mycobacterium wuenschmannii]WIM86248.1 hypothetical protein PT015_15165 [Candidatus Mycobacterium wuenschmannii]
MAILPRGLTAAAAMTLVAVGTAVPAQALGPPPDGVYSFTEAGVPTTSWRISALCDAPSRQRAIPDFSDPVIAADLCSLNVSSYTDRSISRAEKLANFVGRARLTSDRWTFQVGKSNGVICPDGSTAETTDTYAFDDVSLTGTHTSIHSDICGLQAGMTKTPFTLALRGPLPNPVDRYPLDCNEIGQCR